MELSCKFKSQKEVVERGTFKSRKVWVLTEDNPSYPQTIEIEVNQDKVDLFNNIKEGTPLTAHLNLRGREWTNPEGKTSVFNSLVCWKVDGIIADQEPERKEPDKAATKKAKQEPDDEFSDLPF